MGVAFDNVTMCEAVATAMQLIDRGGGATCVTPNSEIVYEAMHDSALRALLNEADLVLPDGSGIVLAARILGRPLRQKVAGIDFADCLCAELARQGRSLYLLGAKPGIAQQAAENLCQRHPGLIIAGVQDGYFQDAQAAAAQVRQAAPDVLFVCLGAPKQENFMKQHREALGARFMAGLGGSLDGFAGTVKRAPKWMQRLGLEWLYRLIREPWRFKRMLRLPKFILAVIGTRLRGKHHG